MLLYRSVREFESVTTNRTVSLYLTHSEKRLAVATAATMRIWIERARDQFALAVNHPK